MGSPEEENEESGNKNAKPSSEGLPGVGVQLGEGHAKWAKGKVDTPEEDPAFFTSTQHILGPPNSPERGPEPSAPRCAY